MAKRNERIRSIAKANGVYWWEIADMLNISEPTIMRWLRHELPEEKKAAIEAAINQIVSQRHNDQR